MAIAAEERNKSGIFWINDTSDDDQVVVYVPGVSRKPGPRQGSGSTEEGKGRAPVGLVHDKGNKRRQSQQSSHSVLSAAGMSSTKMTPSARSALAKAKSPAPTPKPEDQQGSAQVAHVKTKPSLRDLCLEDKRRIANLIQELARVSEEKEESVQKLRDEQETFERKILQLEQQNHLILQERESLQQQYRECQELLSLYQQYLTQQQDKLNQSIAQLNQAHSHTKASRSERSTRRSRSAKAATLNGSYLDLPSPRDTPVNRATAAAAAPTPKAHSLLASHGCVPATPATPTPTAPPSTIGSSVSDPKPRSAARPRREPHSCSRAHPGPVAATTVLQGPEGGAEEGERRGGGWAGVPAAPPAGWEDWEERRQRLVEQKRQLEQERERLQQRLALQEERLSQQLQQTRSLNDGLQQADVAGLEKPHPNGSLLNQPPEVNGCGGHSERGSTSHLAVAAAVLSSDVPSCGDPNLGPPKHISSQETPPLTKKDMATSPAVPLSAPLSPPPAPAVPSCLPHTPHLPRRASPNSSLVELLEIFSPISLVECPRPRAPTSALRPPHHILLSPTAAHPRSCLPQQDPEESQILEDIFFIC